MNKTGWIIFSVVVALLLGGLVTWTRLANPPVNISGVKNNSVIAASAQNGNIADHTTGSTSNKILFIEYGDFQCPSCGGAYPGVNQLIEKYGTDVTFIFRNFPLTTIHPNARAAAAVAEAAGLQGKYWEMHNKLYETQKDWETLDATQRTTVFESYAKELGLDIAKYNADLVGKPVSQKINFDIAMGKSVNVNGTPTFFLNGDQVDSTTSGALVNGDAAPMAAKLDAAVKAANGN